MNTHRATCTPLTAACEACPGQAADKRKGLGVAPGHPRSWPGRHPAGLSTVPGEGPDLPSLSSRLRESAGHCPGSATGSRHSVTNGRQTAGRTALFSVWCTRWRESRERTAVQGTIQRHSRPQGRAAAPPPRSRTSQHRGAEPFPREQRTSSSSSGEACSGERGATRKGGSDVRRARRSQLREDVPSGA